MRYNSFAAYNHRLSKHRALPAVVNSHASNKWSIIKTNKMKRKE